MDRKRVGQIKEQFDLVIHRDETAKVEFWYARELMPLLGYERWENFDKAISRAMDSCETSGIEVVYHFREVTKMIETGKGAHRPVKDYMLTRYDCYLIAQNGDPKKEEIAFAQSYFAVQTRKQELIEERISLIERTEARGRLRESEKRLSQNIYERGVDDAGFGRIRSKGDQALFGGHTTMDMKARLGVKDNRPLADFLPTLTIAAKNLATEMTNYNVEEKDLQGERAITGEHVQNNLSVREMLGQRGRGFQLVLAHPDGIVLFDEEVQDVREEMIGALHLRFALAPDAGEHVLNPLFVQTEPHGSAQNLLNVLIVGDGLARQHAAEPLSFRQHDGNREIAEAQGTDVDSLALRLPGGRAAGQSTLTVMNHLAELRHAEGLRRAPALRIDDDGGHAGALGPVLNQFVELVHVAKFLKAQGVVSSVGFRFRSVGRVHGGSSSYVI